MQSHLQMLRDSEVLGGAQIILAKLFPEPKLEKVLLVTPPDADRSIFNPEVALRGTYSNFPPYGLALLANILEGSGVNTDILNLEKGIYEAAGEEFNIASPKQLGIILFEKMKLVDKPKKTKTMYKNLEYAPNYNPDHEYVRK